MKTGHLPRWLCALAVKTCCYIFYLFTEALVEENKNKAEKEKEREKSKVKSKKCKQKKKDERVTNIDSNANYRKMLFEKIQEQKENVKGILDNVKIIKNTSLAWSQMKIFTWSAILISILKWMGLKWKVCCNVNIFNTSCLPTNKDLNMDSICKYEIMISCYLSLYRN